MTVLYEDSKVVLDDDAITIRSYYFPCVAKRIPYRAIRGVEDRRMGLWTRLRIWGTSDLRRWFHLDFERPLKKRAIVLDVGGWVRPGLTPDDHDRVLRILRQKIGSG
jgi:hypothetical protein